MMTLERAPVEEPVAGQDATRKPRGEDYSNLTARVEQAVRNL